MLVGDTGRVNGRTIAIAAVLVLALAAAAVWFVAPDTFATGVRQVRAGLSRVTPRAATNDSSQARGTGTEASTQASPTTASSAVPGGEPAEGDPSPVDTQDDTTLALADSAVLITYPDGFDLAVTPEQVLVDSQVPPCDEGFDYCIYLHADEFADTNFSSAGLGIVARDDLTNEASCMLQQPDGYVDLVPIVAGASDYATTMYHGVDQGAAGHHSSGSVGRLYYDSACYEFETRVAQAQLSNFPSGAVQEFDEADEEATAARLMSVMARVTLPDGRSSLWGRRTGATDGQVAGERASGTSAYPELRAPLVGADVTSPLRLAGEAPGSWFFEASFPFRLVAADGEVLATGAVAANGDWMTESLVPFEQTIDFEVQVRTAAVLHLNKDNPSALPENDAAIEVPLHLLP